MMSQSPFIDRIESSAVRLRLSCSATTSGRAQ